MTWSIHTLEPHLRKKTLLSALYFFLIMTAYYIIKPVRGSLVLTNLGAAQLPVLYIACSVMLSLVAVWHARCVRRWPVQRLMQGILVMIIGQLLLIRMALAVWPGATSQFFYVWVSMFSVGVVTQFWMVVNDLFTEAEARRLFGFVGAGGILGGVAGSAATKALLQWMTTENLLLVAAVVLGMCVWLMARLWALHAQQTAAAQTQQAQAVQRMPEPPPASLWYYLKSFQSVRGLLLLVILIKGVSTIIDYQFNTFVELGVTGAEMEQVKLFRTAFFANFYLIMNLVSFSVQFFLTGRLLTTIGPRKSLAVLPMGLVAGSVGLLIMPGLLLAGLVALFDRCVGYSLNQTSKEVLYVPIPSAIRYQVKPLIDMAAFRWAQGLAGLGLLLTRGMTPGQISLAAIPLIGFWLLTIYRINEHHPVS